MSIFMHYGTIKGETTDKGHIDWIDIDEVFFGGVARRVTSNSGTSWNREASNAEFKKIALIKHMDKATPNLFIDSCCGKAKDLTLHFVKTTSAERGADVVLEYILGHALITDYKVCANIYSRRRPSEKLLISFTKMQLRYISYGENGEILGPVAVSYNSSTNALA